MERAIEKIWNSAQERFNNSEYRLRRATSRGPGTSLLQRSWAEAVDDLCDDKHCSLLG